MANARVPIPRDVAAEILFATDRTCCVCNVRGRPVQLHHIDEHPDNNEPHNLAALCLDCHNETQLNGGFGRHLNAAQVIKYRDDWHLRVANRRAEADLLAATVSEPLRAVGFAHPSNRSEPPVVPPSTGLLEYLNTLPALRRLAYEAAQPGWAASTADMVEASYGVIEVFEGVLARLARYYPNEHFDANDPRNYFSEVIATRFRWHHHRRSTAGVGYSGTIAALLTASDVVRDVERMLVDLVSALTMSDDDERFSYQKWRGDWDAAVPPASDIADA